MVAGFKDRIQLSTPIEWIRRFETHVLIKPVGMEAIRFDRVFIACHSNQALTLLSDPTRDEKEITLLDEDPRIDGPHSASDNWSEFTTDLVVGWQFNDGIRIYAKRAEGYNAGVFSLGALNHSDYTDFEVFDTPADPEEITSYEIGMKSEWLDRTVRVNAAAYFNDNENLQVTEVVNGVRTVSNSGENESYGFELDFAALLGERFTLDGAYGYRKTDFDDEQNFGRSDGKHSGRLSLVYGVDTSFGYLDARIDTTYTDAQNFSSSPYGNSEDRTLIGARVGVSEIELDDYGVLRAAVWGRNFDYPCQILYLPQNANSGHTIHYLRGEYDRLKRGIEEIADRRVTDDDLRNSLAVFNENRALLRDLYALKRDAPWLVSADEAYVLVAVGGLIQREEHNALLQHVLPQLNERPVKQQDRSEERR